MTGMDCIFCHLNRSILAETKLSLACLDSFPVSKGHTLVIPKRHVVSLWEMTIEEYTDAFALVRQVKGVLQEQFHPQGFNVGVNCGQAAGHSPRRSRPGHTTRTPTARTRRARILYRARCHRPAAACRRSGRNLRPSAYARRDAASKGVRRGQRQADGSPRRRAEASAAENVERRRQSLRDR